MKSGIEKSNKKRPLNWIADLKEDWIDFNTDEKNINKDFILSFLVTDNILSLIKNGDDNSKYFNELMLYKVLLDFNDSRKHLRNIAENKTRLMNTLLSNEIENIIKKEFSLLHVNANGNLTKSLKTKTKSNVNEYSFVEKLFENDTSKSYLNVNTFEGVTYFNKESFEELLKWILYFTNLYRVKETFYPSLPAAKSKKKTKKVTSTVATDKVAIKSLLEDFKITSESYKRIKEATIKSGYKVEELKKLLTTKVEKKKSIKETSEEESFSKTKKKKAKNKYLLLIRAINMINTLHKLQHNFLHQ